MRICQLIKLQSGSYQSILLIYSWYLKSLSLSLSFNRIQGSFLKEYLQLFHMGNQISGKPENFTYAIDQNQFQSDSQIFNKGIPASNIQFIRTNNLQTWKKKGIDKYFCGKFVDDKAQGLGTIFIPNQMLYQGYIHKGFPHGTGKINFINRMQMYEGNFQNGMAHGKGKYEKYTDNNKFHFIGQWLHSHPSKGMFIPVNNEHVKSIQVTNFKAGDAIINFHNGNVYTGKINCYFEPHGRGVMKYNHNNSKVLIYDGQFKRGQFHGQGHCKWRDGSYYTGHYVHGHKEGEGTYKYSSGEIYQGHWQAGSMNGKGKLIKNGNQTLNSLWIAGIPLLAVLGDQPNQKLFSHEKLPIIHASQRSGQVSAGHH